MLGKGRNYMHTCKARLGHSFNCVRKLLIFYSQIPGTALYLFIYILFDKKVISLKNYIHHYNSTKALAEKKLDITSNFDWRKKNTITQIHGFIKD